MKHTIISWDCSYRNFYHLIDSLLDQKYDRKEFEFIYVEQRPKEVADSFNHKSGLKSLWDRYQEVKNEINFQVIYLNDAKDIPYHLGRTVNKGIEEAKGDIISVMDGDLLVPPDFLTKLENYHLNQETAIVNLMRHMCNKPVDVEKDNWVNQTIDFQRCLEVCPTKNDPIPREVNNKGPLISANKKYWKAIGGYDEHRIWSTGLSRLGQDVTARLEILTGVESTALPNCFSVHPWHPRGFLGTTINSQKLRNIQQEIIDWAIKHDKPLWEERLPFTEKVYSNNKEFIEQMVDSNLKNPGDTNVNVETLKSRFYSILGLLYRKTRKISKKYL